MSSLINAFANLFKGIGGTYSFKDLVGALTSPLAGAFTFAGTIGSGKITVEMLTENGGIDMAVDGTAMPWFQAGKSARITIECQQTSTLHKFMLFWANLHITAARSGDISNWAGTNLLLRNAVDGTSHECLGVIPTKIPEKAYAGQPTPITWVILAANVNNL